MFSCLLECWGESVVRRGNCLINHLGLNFIDSRSHDSDLFYPTLVKQYFSKKVSSRAAHNSAFKYQNLYNVFHQIKETEYQHWLIDAVFPPSLQPRLLKGHRPDINYLNYLRRFMTQWWRDKMLWVKTKGQTSEFKTFSSSCLCSFLIFLDLVWLCWLVIFLLLHLRPLYKISSSIRLNRQIIQISK